jgi:hypothetical protein
MVDLDLLVPRSDLDRAHLALQEHLGFEVLGARLHRDDERRLETAHHHWPLLSRAGTVVELHHRLLDDRVEYEVGELWERATPSTRGPAHLLPSPEDLALHVAVHFSFDRVHRRESALGQLADLVRIAERWDLDWEVIIERARAARLVHRTFLALTTAAALFGDLAPPELVAPLAPDSYTPERGAAFIRQRVLAEGPSIPLEQIQEMGARRLFPGRSSMERYVRPGEPTPSLTRLRLRRLRAISRRFVTELPRPAALVRDARLSRWIMTLQE